MVQLLTTSPQLEKMAIGDVIIGRFFMHEGKQLIKTTSINGHHHGVNVNTGDLVEFDNDTVVRAYSNDHYLEAKVKRLPF